MNHSIPTRLINAPLDPPEVVEAKLRALESKRARDFDTFLRSLERGVK